MTCITLTGLHVSQLATDSGDSVVHDYVPVQFPMSPSGFERNGVGGLYPFCVLHLWMAVQFFQRFVSHFPTSSIYYNTAVQRNLLKIVVLAEFLVRILSNLEVKIFFKHELS